LGSDLKKKAGLGKENNKFKQQKQVTSNKRLCDKSQEKKGENDKVNEKRFQRIQKRLM